jgi:UDP-N-acetylmuramate dehydrogenase
MKKHTTFRLGGNAEILVTPNKYTDIQAIIEVCNKFGTKYYLIGNGSNTLVKDSGFDGVIIKTSHLNKIEIDDTKITAQCGALLPVLAQHALKSALTGMEFLSGIPGTVGGAVCMNAGAYGKEICSVIESVKILYSNGTIRDLKREEISFSYRHTDLQDQNIIVLETSFKLEHGDINEIKSYTETLRKKRQTTQPLEHPNAGSIFKKCGEFPAGYLIDRAGLKGYSVGGAQVSEKHANFIVNKGSASASDIIALIEYIEKVIKEKDNLILDTEVIIL